jgi:hypothetical protein
MFGDAYLAILRFMEMGGDVLYLIAIITFLMWTLIFADHPDLCGFMPAVWFAGHSDGHDRGV